MKEEKRKTCLNCETILVHPEGRRPKKFCNDSCKAAHWRKNHKGKGKFVDRKKYDDLKAELEALKLASISGENVSKEISAKVKEIKVAEPPKSNYTIDTTKDFYPGRLPGESSIDYRVRMAEEREKAKNKSI